MTKALVVLALTVVLGGFTHRYYIVNGPDYVVVGRSMFWSYVYAHTCRKVWSKRYPRERVVIHQCEL